MGFFGERLTKLYEALPDLAVTFTSDVIVGFPGETEEEFMDTYNMIINSRSYNVFPFSPRTGTPATRMEDQIDEDIKNERVHRLISLNDQLAKEYASRFEDQVLEVIPEEFVQVGSEEEGLLTGYTDNYLKVVFEGSESLIGQLVMEK